MKFNKDDKVNHYGNKGHGHGDGVILEVNPIARLPYKVKFNSGYENYYCDGDLTKGNKK